MDKIPNEIYKDLIGKPFKYGGRGEDGYYDCLGLAYEMLERLGIIMPKDDSIIDLSLRQSALEEGKSMFEKIDKPEIGCLAGFYMLGYLCHVGIPISNTRFIHAQRNKRVCIEKITSPVWSNRLDGFYSYIGENISE